jgi:hypothetical protein
MTRLQVCWRERTWSLAALLRIIIVSFTLDGNGTVAGPQATALGGENGLFRNSVVFCQSQTSRFPPLNPGG